MSQNQNLDHEPAVGLLADLFAGKRSQLGFLELGRIASALQRHQPLDLIAAAARQWRELDPEAMSKLRRTLGL